MEINRTISVGGITHRLVWFFYRKINEDSKEGFYQSAMGVLEKCIKGDGLY